MVHSQLYCSSKSLTAKTNGWNSKNQSLNLQFVVRCSYWVENKSRKKLSWQMSMSAYTCQDGVTGRANFQHLISANLGERKLSTYAIPPLVLISDSINRPAMGAEETSSQQFIESICKNNKMIWCTSVRIKLSTLSVHRFNVPLPHSHFAGPLPNTGEPLPRPRTLQTKSTRSLAATSSGTMWLMRRRFASECPEAGIAALKISNSLVLPVVYDTSGAPNLDFKSILQCGVLRLLAPCLWIFAVLFDIIHIL